MKRYLILGAPDAVTAQECSRLKGVKYIWASSFIMSTILGLKDDGIVHFERYVPLISSLIRASRRPVIMDFDVGGRNIPEFIRNAKLLKELKIGGVSIEDEKWPKVNAMLKRKTRRLLSSSVMAKKISLSKKILGKRALVIARTHSFLAGESLVDLQSRIDVYQKAGADIICIHYAGMEWGRYRRVLDELKIVKPLLLILSKRNHMPSQLRAEKRIKYVLYPNQLYRTMVLLGLSALRRANSGSNRLGIAIKNMVDVKMLFDAIERVKKPS